MENNKENKEKFFAQYWGQKVVAFRIGKSIIDGYTIGYSNQYNTLLKMEDYGLKNAFLKLTSLSQITDEDAIKVAKIIGYTKAMGFDMRKKANMIEMVKEYLSKYLPTIQVGDYLRSKSYLLPFMGLSEEELVNRGWARIKEE